jgi:radical SAM protein with 4Fe4S-binding SPASM domain
MKLIDIEAIRHVPFEAFLVHLPDADGLMKVFVDSDYLALLRLIDSTGLSGLTYRTIGSQHPQIYMLLGPKPEEALHGAFVHSRAGNVDANVIAPRSPHTGAIRCAKERTNKNVLLPNGDVVLCCMDYGLRHILGNLIDSDYASLYQSREYRRVISSFASSDCDSLCRRCEWAEAV